MALRATPASDSLVLRADAGAGGADLAGRTLEFGVGAFAGAALTGTASVADLSVLGEAGGGLQGAVAGAAGVVGIADALPAVAAPVSCGSRGTTVLSKQRKAQSFKRIRSYDAHLRRACCWSGRS